VIVVDGDGTLWTGSAGEIGPDGVYLDGPRAVLARRLLQWRAAGVLLVLVSNNDEATIEAVLGRPDALVRAEHFTLISAGWEPKAKRIGDAAHALNLGLDSFLFLDDNPVEVAAVRSAQPEVQCVTCPAAGELESFVSRLWPLVPMALTGEDAARADFYREERSRDAAREQASFAEFLGQLALEVDVAPLSDASAERSAQLIRRVSQFTIRAPADTADLAWWRGEGDVWTASARDRFGDYGQIGVLAIRADGCTLEVRAWVLSCRALGRGVEERLLQWLADHAEARQCSAVRVVAEHTARNEPARRLVAALGGGQVDDQSLAAVVPPQQLRTFRSWER
jgi:FkbH-like protein